MGNNSDNTNEIISMYTRFLNRAPDEEGLAFWTNQLSSGLSLDSVSQVFESSLEVKNFLADKESDLSKLYASVFDRSPDSDGLRYWESVYIKYYEPYLNGQRLSATPALSEKTTTVYDYVKDGFEYASFTNTRAAGLRVAAHIHPFPSKTTVLQGEVTVFMDGAQPQVFKAGDTYEMPAFVRMAPLSSGDVPMVVQDFFVIPVGLPLWIIDENLPGKSGMWGLDQSQNRNFEQIAELFLSSPEGLNNYSSGMSNEELVRKAYQNLEHQTITADLLSSYVKELEDGVRFAHVLVQMIEPTLRMPPLTNSSSDFMSGYCDCCVASIRSSDGSWFM